MTVTRLLFAFFLLSFFNSCSVTNQQKQGTVNPESFHSRTAFTLYKSLILLPVVINPESKNFIFDTGAQLTGVQSESVFGKTINVEGASGRKLKMGKAVVKSISIGNVEFQNTYALHQNLAELKERIPDFGGFIGQSIIQKANWLIDYPNRKMEISNNELSDATFTHIEISRKDGTPYTFISISGKKYKAIINLGATRSLSIPENSKLAKDLIKTNSFEDVEKDNYTIGGGLTKIKQKIGHIPLVTLGRIENIDVETAIKETSNIRIGIGLFKNYLFYIDNINGHYKIKKEN